MNGVDNKEQQGWDAWWERSGGYNEYPSVAWDLMDDDKIRYLLNRIGSRRGRVLEVGCGTARMSVRLAGAGFNTVCLDKSYSAMPLARDNYGKHNLTFNGLAADGYRLPFADNTFDGVLSTGLLEHFADPTPLIKEMVRVANPGGFIYADILPWKRWRLLLLFDFIRPMLSRYTDDLKEYSFKGKEIDQLARKAGLKEISVFSAGIFWPRWPVLRSSRLLVGMENMICRLTHPLFKAFDRSMLADIFGIYYFMFGRKKSKPVSMTDEHSL